MRIIKVVRDNINKVLLGPESVPKGMFDLSEYTRYYKGIDFGFEKKGTKWIAKSKNFKYGHIITEGKDLKDLDKNIKDAILTAFDIPSSFKHEASVVRIDEKKKEYALA